MRDEGELIRAAVEGDLGAFDELVLRKRERVIRIAFQVTGDLEEAKDVAQAVFLRLWRVLRRFDPGRRFDTWLYRMTVNLAIDQLRTHGPKGIFEPLPSDPALPAPSARFGPEQSLDLAALQRAFLRLAARLAPKQRAAFVLREIDGLETAEVARILGVRESTVRNHLHQARRILRAGLERDYPALTALFGDRGTGGGAA